MILNLTDATYAKALADAEAPVIVVFRAGFCGPSAALDPIVAEIVAEYEGRVAVAIIDVEECPKMTKALEVKGTPSVIVFNLGVPLASRIGTMTFDEFADWIDETVCKA